MTVALLLLCWARRARATLHSILTGTAFGMLISPQPTMAVTLGPLSTRLQTIPFRSAEFATRARRLASRPGHFAISWILLALTLTQRDVACLGSSLAVSIAATTYLLTRANQPQ